MNRSPTPTTLLAFVKAAELGSFAAAAKHLEMSAAAVGQAVARLEQDFGVKLLDRTTRRMRVTADGRDLLARSADIVRELAELGRVFEERRGQVAGPLRVSAPSGLARRHILPVLARFISTHPNVAVTLDASDAIRDFVGDGVDVAFRILRPTDATWVARRLATLPAITVASPEYLERHGVPGHPRELVRHVSIGYRYPASSALAPMRFRIGRRETTVVSRSAITVNDAETACEAAALGLGIAQPPAYYVTEHLASGRLVRILDRHASTSWTLYVCYPSAKHLPMRARAFVEMARAELADLA